MGRLHPGVIANPVPTYDGSQALNQSSETRALTRPELFREAIGIYIQIAQLDHIDRMFSEKGTQRLHLICTVCISWQAKQIEGDINSVPHTDIDRTRDIIQLIAFRAVIGAKVRRCRADNAKAGTVQAGCCNFGDPIGVTTIGVDIKNASGNRFSGLGYNLRDQVRFQRRFPFTSLAKADDWIVVTGKAG